MYTVTALSHAPTSRTPLTPPTAAAMEGRLKMHDLKMQDWKMTDHVN